MTESWKWQLQKFSAVLHFPQTRHRYPRKSLTWNSLEKFAFTFFFLYLAQCSHSETIWEQNLIFFSKIVSAVSKGMPSGGVKQHYVYSFWLPREKHHLKSNWDFPQNYCTSLFQFFVQRAQKCEPMTTSMKAHLLIFFILFSFSIHFSNLEVLNW